jgi:hypothetical protein
LEGRLGGMDDRVHPRGRLEEPGAGGEIRVNLAFSAREDAGGMSQVAELDDHVAPPGAPVPPVTRTFICRSNIVSAKTLSGPTS